MTLAQRLQDDLTRAIRERDDLRRDSLRMAIAAVYNAQKGARRDLSDDEVVSVLMGEIKARRETIEALEGAGRAEATTEEQGKLDVISGYLPEQLSSDELDTLVRTAIDETGAASPRDMGKVMAALMPRVKGRAEGKQVSGAVARELARRDLSGHGH
ncbi:MAG TPA: GatB/YqeY domain-containing protein [Candidatus Limnocylindrales bacterium]|nr:GatB/YqeY domain-containing protein [Candidatus Limnocylindrales bacterium]